MRPEGEEGEEVVHEIEFFEAPQPVHLDAYRDAYLSNDKKWIAARCKAEEFYVPGDRVRVTIGGPWKCITEGYVYTVETVKDGYLFLEGVYHDNSRLGFLPERFVLNATNEGTFRIRRSSN